MFKINTCSNQIKYSILLYIFLIGIFVYFKPQITFKKDGSLKDFGTSNNKNVTIYPLWFICFILSIISYYIILFLCSIKK